MFFSFADWFVKIVYVQIFFDIFKSLLHRFVIKDVQDWIYLKFFRQTIKLKIYFNMTLKLFLRKTSNVIFIFQKMYHVYRFCSFFKTTSQIDSIVKTHFKQIQSKLFSEIHFDPLPPNKWTKNKHKLSPLPRI